jgi:uncharacterized membrane protein
MEQMLRHAKDFVHMGIIGITGVRGADVFTWALNGQGEMIVLKNVFLLLGIIALIVKIYLMVKKNVAE